MRISLFSWLFMILLTIIFFEINGVLVSGQCQSDQELLLQLKSRLKFNSSLSVKLEKWNQSPDCCMWNGVKCDAGGRVIDLDLSEEWIIDGIDNSSSLFNLQHLQSLNLAYNSFYSRFPTGFDKLENLKHLNLSNAGFKGLIPLEISRMKSLVTLDLSIDFLMVGSLLKLENPNLVMLVRNLKEIKHLYLDGVNMSAQGKEWCQALSSSLPNLQVLSMSNCYLSGPLDASLSKLRSLSVIRLDANNFSSPFPDFLAELSNLTSLHLASTNLQGKVAERIFQVLTLKTLDLSGNPLLEGSLKEFLPASSLETLLLSKTHFGGTLPESIGNLGRLSRIELANCHFNGSIPKAMVNLTQLVSLDFSTNNFSGLIPSFASAKNLTQLNLGHNQLTGSILSTDWSSLSKLVSIDLRNNSLNGTIPATLFSIPSLQRIALSQNHFTGGLNAPPKLAYSVLQSLELSSNRLAGPLPKFLFGLRSLRILILSSNNFNGQLYISSFVNLRNLSTLDLSYNRLSIDTRGTSLDSFPHIGTLKLASCKLKRFPDFFKEKSNLWFLDLSDNQIDGDIPNWIWNLSSLNYLNLSQNFLVNLQEPLQDLGPNLTVLDLHGNKLQGQLPKPPAYATYVDYSSNNFSSILSMDIGYYLEFTYFFALSSNSLHGSIPKSICSATYLRVLDLSNNSLNGTIPRCLTSMDSLGVVNLRGNILSGNISDTFSRNCSTQTLDLNGNHLEGKIPKSLANCAMLEVLDLGNNQINDTFPCHLKNISSLHVLVLRSNNFHGLIGCPDGRSSWPMLQIIDLASNHFEGELPYQWLRTWKAMMVDSNELKVLNFEVLPLNALYYQDAVTITNKGFERRLVKIFSLLTSVDFSCNKFEGQIPEILGEFKVLYALNLSHNGFTSLIPSSLGNLQHLESLDLPSNSLSGEIPQQLANLNFLTVLNLSHNQLEGRIPKGNQLQTFSKDSFNDNKGLCGVPLKENCKSNVSSTSEGNNSNNGTHIDWNLISVEVGFVFGLAIVILPLVFWKRWRIWYCKRIDTILFRLLP
ncbi:hypothetical protein SLEP1_g31938 [Rubroshorea leprosula]|uniref:Leucine-rich repeat-containing N-terminal plant-type domain-containing protein n=1 Tax=Rubroshorea leprosula TaxID=152421 RepID=A0AAV5KBU1_9ROSI|nr:hypothetical protein SLEP1_g31938 [Rubroshorea leprosula]